MTSDPRDVIRYGQLIERLLRITGVDRPEHLAAAVQNLATAFRTSTPVGPDPLVLTLPEVPAEAVALYGLRTGTRYKPDQDGVWRINSWDGDLADVLRREHPEGARVELAPPREPRTVALDELDALRQEIATGWWEMDEPGKQQAYIRIERVEQALREVLGDA